MANNNETMTTEKFVCGSAFTDSTPEDEHNPILTW